MKGNIMFKIVKETKVWFHAPIEKTLFPGFNTIEEAKDHHECVNEAVVWSEDNVSNVITKDNHTIQYTIKGIE